MNPQKSLLTSDSPEAEAGVPFPALVLREILRNSYNDFRRENYDEDRFGPGPRSFKYDLFCAVNKHLANCKMLMLSDDVEEIAEKALKHYQVTQEISFLHDLLADDYSKNLLVSLLAFRIIGFRRVKLPSNNPEYWRNKAVAENLSNPRETMQSKFMNWTLPRLDLNRIGIPIELFFTINGVLKTFLLKQYEYNRRTPPIKAEANDVIIDAGGCWGDTALYFAHLAGARGQVHTFEFLQSNLDIMAANLKLNPVLAPRVTLVQKALFHTSGKKMVFEENGPGTKITEGVPANGSTTVTTTTIDDYVRESKIVKVNLIKMDIEGAELAALQGAAETIKRDRPKLAIALYHDLRDFVTIPQFLSSLNLGYRFYLDHFTIHNEETILFAELA
jgi:FkbM family methyltransferase